jgi:peptide/nickel transport system ATP-binding protein
MLIAARNLTKFFELRGGLTGKGAVQAVSDVDVEVREGEIVGVVGESGSGKSTLGRLLLGLIAPTSGEVLFDIPEELLQKYDEARSANDKKTMEEIASKYSITRKSGRELRALRRRMNMMFQDPYSSLNPRWRVEDIIMEPMVSTGYLTGNEARKRVRELLEEVGLPREFAYRYPHELSGGQRQRVALARSISTLPSFLVLDEPTSALDVSAQAQILQLLKRIRERFRIGLLLITHNIAVVSYISDRIYVMYAGKVVEGGPKTSIISKPQHPYTVALISAVPGNSRGPRVILRGEPPNLVDPPKGCRFHPRCPMVMDNCGWTAKEVAEELEFLLRGRYYGMLKEGSKVVPQGELEILVEGAKAEEVRKVIEEEKEEVKSLRSIYEVREGNGGALVKLMRYDIPGMYRTDEGREVSCLIYRKT